MSDFFIILCLILCPIISLWSGFSYIQERRKRRYVFRSREGANKQVISSQADSLIKISRIWADFFPANTSNQPI